MPNYIKLVCQCDPPRTIRTGRRNALDGMIWCAICGKRFEPEEPDKLKT